VAIIKNQKKLYAMKQKIN